MAGERLLVNDLYVRHLRSALRYGSSALGQVPDLIKYIILEEAWRQRFVLQTHQPIRFRRFVDFVTTPPPEGLGTDLATIEELCRVDVEAVMLLDRVTARPRAVHAAAGDAKPVAKRGNRAHAALHRLRNVRPPP